MKDIAETTLAILGILGAIYAGFKWFSAREAIIDRVTTLENDLRDLQEYTTKETNQIKDTFEGSLRFIHSQFATKELVDLRLRNIEEHIKDIASDVKIQNSLLLRTLTARNVKEFMATEPEETT